MIDWRVQPVQGQKSNFLQVGHPTKKPCIYMQTYWDTDEVINTF